MIETFLTLVTLNVLQVGHQAPARYAAIQAELARLAPDVVTLQEVRRLGPRKTSADALLPGYHRAVDGGWVGYHLAILSRHPIKRTVRVPFTNNRSRMAFGAVLDVRGTEVLVLTTHLDYQLDHHAQRRKQLDMTFAAAREFSGPVVVTGDLNFGDGEAESDGIPRDYADAWRVLHPNALGLTWDNERNPMAKRGRLPGEPSRRLDRILSRGLRPQHAEIVFDEPIRDGLFPSDHFGVLASLGRPR